MPAPRKHILVADDNGPMANVIRFNLERAGYRVTIGYGPKVADWLNEQQFDLILTDFQMPGLRGDELCAAARASENHRETPIAMCTAKGLELDQQQLIDTYQLSCIFWKPFSPREIVGFVRQTLNPADETTRIVTPRAAVVAE